LSELTPDQQQVIVLRFGEGRKIGEVSLLMGKSEGSVKLLQYRAVNRLRRLLENRRKTGAQNDGKVQDTPLQTLAP